ncbi:MAG: hypothetical protein ACFFFO_04790 [Candidatus Thorarchaeota archaeon]
MSKVPVSIDVLIERMIRDPKFRKNVCQNREEVMERLQRDLTEEEMRVIDLLCRAATTISELEDGLGGISRTLGVTDR